MNAVGLLISIGLIVVYFLVHLFLLSKLIEEVFEDVVCPKCGTKFRTIDPDIDLPYLPAGGWIPVLMTRDPCPECGWIPKKRIVV